jgi:hypothetical protein
MGFKKIDLDELKTKIGQNFLGMPIREGGKIVQKSRREKKIESSYSGSISEVLILNEEFIEFQYDDNGSRTSVTGNGNISVFNNSVKDRIWDANLQFSGSQFSNQKEENDIDLGIFEPSSNKVLKYEIVNSDDLPDLIKVNEEIKLLNDDIKVINNDTKSSTLDENENFNKNSKINHLLLLGKENKVKFTINIENVSNSVLEKIKFRKSFSNNFYDFELDGSNSKDFKVTQNVIECSLNNLNPGAEAQIAIIANVFPKKRENIKTGSIELTCNLSNKAISGVSISHFSGYSHAMHAIKKSEKNHAPNNWQCSLIFENHSDFKMKLKSILVFDKTKSQKFLDLDFRSSNNTIINPHGKYKSAYFDFINEKEPTFSRKVEYSVDFKTESNSMFSTKFEDNVFKVASIAIKKKLSENEIKSFEKTIINSKIILNNLGTQPINSLRIVERVPEDFLPPRNIADYTLYRSTGKFDVEDIVLKISPDDDDPSHEHTLELNINLDNPATKSVIEVEDFLEVEYPLAAVTPDYEKAYNFPLKVHTFYPKYDGNGASEYYSIIDDLTTMDKSSIKVSHKRRKLMIGKEIFPGRSSNEFAIYITARNGSNIKLNEVDITDFFPNSFELVSSNVEHKLTKSKKNGEQKISFSIDTILPYQEKEIMYYLKTMGGKKIKKSKIKSFFIGKKKKREENEMKLQFYEMMEDKSKEYLMYLIEQILPQFTKNELKTFLGENGADSTKSKKNTKTKSKNKYTQIGKDIGDFAELSKLTMNQLKLLFQIFISREKNDKHAVKWRFYQYLKYKMDLKIKSIKINLDPNPDLVIDFIIETEEKEVILALCYDILELKNYKKALEKVSQFVKSENLIPDRIIFSTGKSFRNIPIDTSIKIINEEILPELWIEWVEENRPFNKEDLLIVNDSDLKLAGFNFISTDDLLNYVFKHTEGGQISLYRQVDFFTETSEEEPVVELFWKGIMLK